MAERKIQKERQARKLPHGRQSVKKLMGHGTATSSIPIDAPRQFDKVARRWNVDYAFYKTGEGKHLLFFKSGQADAITACFSEYSRRVLKRGKSRKAPVMEQLKQAKKQIQRQPKRERKKEAVREER